LLVIIPQSKRVATTAGRAMAMRDLRPSALPAVANRTATRDSTCIVPAIVPRSDPVGMLGDSVCTFVPMPYVNATIHQTWPPLVISTAAAWLRATTFLAVNNARLKRRAVTFAGSRLISPVLRSSARNRDRLACACRSD
jgi:hypothetical protein